MHPLPTPKRCFLATAGGRVMFDAATDVGPARDLPREAYRRFRADLRARKAQNLKLRAENLALHEEKTRVIAAWVAEHGSEDQRGRHAAGLLPVEEVIDALTDEAFSTVTDQPRYPLDGAARLQDHLRDRDRPREHRRRHLRIYKSVGARRDSCLRRAVGRDSAAAVAAARR